MGRKIFGMDFGTSVVKMYKKGNGVVLEEKNVIAVKDDNKVLAVGDGAYEMIGKSPKQIAVSMPVKHGVIADIGYMKMVFNNFMERLTGKKMLKGADYLLAVPTDITRLEKRAFYELVYQSNGKPKYVSVVDKPIAAALGMDIDITNSRGIMTVDIGADTTEIAIMSLGGIVLSKIIPIGGRNFDVSIGNAVKKIYNLYVGEKTAEAVKIALASAISPQPECVSVYGRDIVSGLPREVQVQSDVVYEAIKEQLFNIILAIKSVLERTPPEIASDIMEDGIYVTGGSAKIKHLSELIESETTLHANISADAGNAVVKGLGVMIENNKLMSLAMPVK